MQLSLTHLCGAGAIGFVLSDLNGNRSKPIQSLGFTLGVVITSVALSILFGTAGFYAGLTACSLYTVGTWAYRKLELLIEGPPRVKSVTPETLEQFLDRLAFYVRRAEFDNVGGIYKSARIKFTIKTNDVSYTEQFCKVDIIGDNKIVDKIIATIKKQLENTNDFKGISIYFEITKKFNDMITKCHFTFSEEDQKPASSTNVVSNEIIDEDYKEALRIDDNLEFLL